MPFLVACLLAAILAASASAPAGADAHASLEVVRPAAGATLRHAPRRLTLDFSEALNRSLSNVRLFGPDGRRLPLRIAFSSPSTLVAFPRAPLPRGAYRVTWHSVATDDGHTLDGAYSFGVRAPAAGGSSISEPGPFAGTGVPRMLVRTLLYLSLFVLAGDALLRRARGPWLTPAELDGGEVPAELVLEARRRHARLVDLAGACAVAAASAAALLDARLAAGTLRPAALATYLLHGAAGLGRTAVAPLTFLAWRLVRRRPVAAAGAACAAMASLAASGHAASAHPRGLALTADAVHVLAGSLWAGGLVALVFTWGPLLARCSAAARRVLLGAVIRPFGQVAQWAFAAVLATGALGAVIELGSLDELWRTGYGRVLLVKATLVAGVALVAYQHAFRLRRLVAAELGGARVERRHWRLLRAEPLGVVCVLAAAGLLVGFPLPPKQLAESLAKAPSAGACVSCPLPLPPAGGLAVGDEAGPYVAAMWLDRSGSGRIRLLDFHGLPPRQSVQVRGAAARPCGPGCVDVSRVRARELLVRPSGAAYPAARLPVGFAPHSSRLAHRLLARAQATMRRLRFVRVHDRITSGPGSLAVGLYRLQWPDRQELRTRLGERMTIIGSRQWIEEPGLPLVRRPYGEGLPFRTSEFFRWSDFARAALVLRRSPGAVELALFDPGGPVWTRVHVALPSHRVTLVTESSPGQFVSDRFFAFNRPFRLLPPGGSP